MFRKYRVRHYEARVRLARRLMPDSALGADVLVGFPAETGQDFDETVEFIRSQPFTYLHVFTYSERRGTVAAALPDAVPMDVRRERNRVLRELSDEKNRGFRQSMAGRTLSAVTLEQRGVAVTTNYLRVRLAREREPNQLIDVRIGDVSGPCLAETPAWQAWAKPQMAGMQSTGC
jgi:threonylcarbamoyladenosine tRNA methylthiotransferase MtaB